ncbi:MAG: 2-C-methyl-D-erythritol 4-phosphate cytidylyltransferase, partial [Synergistaceae bacterium]|nr:2-C-methyl-D-erythritol 4-phosphate cytidylyltransferase [Synergistaceae bacterium]
MTGRRPTWSFVLVAAGAGRRMGGIPKQFRMLGGTPMWQWSARVAEGLFLNGKIDELVVVFPCGYGGAPEASDLAVPAKYVDGGRTRAESVKKGLESACFEYAMIHDAARPFLPEAICEALMGRALGEVGAIPLLESTDSLKLVDGGISALPRDKIYRTQTPQAFKRATMLDILKSHDAGATDEASLWLEAGYRLEYVPGSQKNFKVTTDFDWAMAKSLAEG